MRGLFIIERKASSIKLGAGTRLFLTFAVSLACLYLSNSKALAVLMVMSSFYVLNGVSVKLIIKAYVIFGIMAFSALICLSILFHLMPWMAKSARGANVIAPFERIFIMVNMVLTMASNSSLAGLTSTMNKVYLPGIIKLPLLVTIRFVPVFFNDLKQVSEAVSLRFSKRGGKKFWLRHPLLWCRIFFMPLIIRLIRSGDELSMASELKGLRPDIKFDDTAVKINRSDIVAIVVMTICITVAVCIQKVVVNA